jgi:aspartate aminotransferase-like enzyme
MECLLINVLSPKDKVLAIVSGKFGERWADMAECYGADVHRLNVTWGESVDPKLVQDFLQQHPDTEIVMTQACETSTATAHDIQKLGKIIQPTKALFLVDGITAVGAYPVPMDQWHIDGLVAGSQKAVMLPTGMSFVSFSEKAWQKIPHAKCFKFYFDIQKEFAANKKGETLFSSNVPLIRALDYVIGRIQSLSLEKHFRQLKRRAEYTRSMAKELGLSLYSKSPSDSVTAINLPSSIDGVKLREHLEKKYLVTIMGGQDQLKGKILRIGHMGYITDADMHETTLRLSNGLKDTGLNINVEKITQTSLQFLKESEIL